MNISQLTDAELFTLSASIRAEQNARAAARAASAARKAHEWFGLTHELGGRREVRDDNNPNGTGWFSEAFTVVPIGMTWKEADDADLPWGSGDTEDEAWADLYDRA